MKTKQNGAVLIVALVLLSALTLLGMHGMQQTMLEERMAKNHQDGVAALVEAENGLAVLRHELEDDVTVATAFVDDVIANDEATLTGNIMPAAEYEVTVSGYRVSGPLRIMNVESVGRTTTLATRTVNAFAVGLDAAVDVDSALSVYDVGDLTLNGNPTISGEDHHVPANFDCNGAGCAGTDNAGGDDVTGIYSEVGSTVTENGVPTVTGDPSHQTGGGSFDAAYWEAFAAAAEASATAWNGDNFGTRAEPVIHVVNGDLAILGNLNGAGILIVKGANLTVGGTFHYEGIILVISETGATLSIGGGSRIFGAVVSVGTGGVIEFTGGGTPEILYSSEAIGMLNNINTWHLRGWFS